MTTSTPRIQPPSAAARQIRAFTLAEVIIAMTLAVLVMGGVMSTVLAITKAGYRSEQYADMEQEARKGLDLFARDVRMANYIYWNSASNITLRIPSGAGSTSYEEFNYYFNDGRFMRAQTKPVAKAAAPLLSGIDPASFSLTGFKITVDPATMAPYQVDTSNLVQASTDTKQLQLSVRLIRNRALVMQTTGDVISARFILRNKQVAN